MIRRFARPYARAIMDVIGTPQQADALRLELAQFEVARKSATDLRDMYANPGIDYASKDLVTKSIGKRLGLSEMALKVLDVLIRNHRINNLDAILEALQASINEALGVVIADVRTAHDLDKSERAELEQTLARKVGRKVDLRLTTDPSLLGGFVAKIGSEIWDASVVGKINKFRTSLA